MSGDAPPPRRRPVWFEWPEMEAVVRLSESELRQGLTAICVELLAAHPRVAAKLLKQLEQGAGRSDAVAVGDGAAAAVLRLHTRLNRELRQGHGVGHPSSST